MFILHKFNIRLVIAFRLNFKMIDIETHVFLQGPYPFYLFWSAQEVRYQSIVIIVV